MLTSDPVVLHISTDEDVRNNDMILHTIGKTKGFGCQEGRRRSLKTGSVSVAFGRELSSGEKKRLRKERNRKNNVVIAF